MSPQIVLETAEEFCPACKSPISPRRQLEYCRISGRKADLKKMFITCPYSQGEYSAAHTSTMLPCDKCNNLIVYEDMGSLISLETETKFNSFKIIQTHKCLNCGTKFIYVKSFNLPLMRF